MDHDAMNRAKMRAEVALADASALLKVMLDTEVPDTEQLEALRRATRAEAMRKGLIKGNTIEATVVEKLHTGPIGTGEISITATVDVIPAGDDNNLEILTPDTEEEPDGNQ